MNDSERRFWLGFEAVTIVGMAVLLAIDAFAKQQRDGNGSSHAQVTSSILAARAAEPGRGRLATSPWQIPWRGWKDIGWRTYEAVTEDRLLAVAAGVVFYGLLALFPALTALISFYGLFAKTSTIGQQIGVLTDLVPGEAISVLQQEIVRLTSNGDAKLGLGFAIGIIVALWSANSGMKAIMDALNVAYEEREKRGFFTLNAISLAFTFGSIAAALLAMGAIVVLPIATTSLGIKTLFAELVARLRWPALCCF
jgi:membrane protein